MPVALSTLGRQSLEDLHAAARQQCAAHPLAVPEEECSLRRLLKAVERQPDPATAVTTALVAVLRVLSRPRLAFPGGRPKPQTAEAASEPRLAEQTGWPAGEQQQQNGRVEEKQPDCTLPGSSYLERFPEVAALMEQFRWGCGPPAPLAVRRIECGLCGVACSEGGMPALAVPGLWWVHPRSRTDASAAYALAPLLWPLHRGRARGQEAKTPLAVVNEYAARLALRVELGEAPAAGAGVFTGGLRAAGRQLWSGASELVGRAAVSSQLAEDACGGAQVHR